MSLGKLGVPIGQTRLVYAIIVSIPIAVFMYLATVNLDWLNLTRFGYLLFGVAAGALLAVLELRVVLSKLSKQSEAFVWEVPLAGLALFMVPFLLVLAFLGSAEYAPFGLFMFFPFMIADLAVSGICFSRYERANEVLVYGFVYGYKYWVQPNPSSDDQFRYFMQAVASKDTTSLWSYMGYSHGFYKKLQRQPVGDSQTHHALLSLVSVMKKYRVVVLAHFVVTMLLTLILFSVLFSSPYRIVYGIQITDVIMPTLLAVWVSLGINVFASMRLVRRNGASIMTEIDSAKLPVQ